MAGKLGDVNF